MTFAQSFKIEGFIEGFIHSYLQEHLRITRESASNDFTQVDPKSFFYSSFYEIFGKESRGENMLIKELAAEAAKLSNCSPENVIVNVAKRAAIAAFREEEKSTIQRIASKLLTLGVTRRC